MGRKGRIIDGFYPVFAFFAVEMVNSSNFHVSLFLVASLLNNELNIRKYQREFKI